MKSALNISFSVFCFYHFLTHPLKKIPRFTQMQQFGEKQVQPSPSFALRLPIFWSTYRLMYRYGSGFYWILAIISFSLNSITYVR